MVDLFGWLYKKEPKKTEEQKKADADAEWDRKVLSKQFPELGRYIESYDADALRRGEKIYEAPDVVAFHVETGSFYSMRLDDVRLGDEKYIIAFKERNLIVITSAYGDEKIVETIRKVEMADVRYPLQPRNADFTKPKDARTRRIDVMRDNPRYDPEFMKATLPIDDHPLLHIESGRYSMYER